MGHKSELLPKFMQKLRNSGYNEKERLDILRSGITTHNKIKELVTNGKRKYYRSPGECSKERERKKSAKYSWFKKTTEPEKYATVMFIEATPNSELISAIKVVEEKYKIAENQRIKFIEKNGRKLIETIRVSDPFRENCKEEDCLPCRNTNIYVNCRKTNIGYTIQCKNCQSKGKTQVYEGESCL